MPRSARILIVEDSPTSAQALSSLIQSLGFDTDIASDGDRALIKAFCHDYALILMDLRLPGADGFALAQAIRGTGNNVPMVSITAYPLSTDRTQCAAAGFDDSLCKGFRRDELETVIRLWAKSEIGRQKLA